MKQFPMKQQGFTLLELLVVITLLAVLSVGALVAYDGVDEGAAAATAANNTSTLDKAIRSYSFVAGEYPDQWDVLVSQTGTNPTNPDNEGEPLLADDTLEALAVFNVSGASGVGFSAKDLLEEAGIEELQYADALTAGVAPNLAHNEGANGTTNTVELPTDNINNLTILPVGPNCTVGTNATTVRQNLEGEAKFAADADAAAFYGKLNDALQEINTTGCHLVAALGFGHDAAHSTLNSAASIAAAPSYAGDINPSKNYARYIGLFWLGSDGNTGTVDGTISVAELNQRAKFLGVMTPTGQTIDDSLAAANSGK